MKEKPHYPSVVHLKVQAYVKDHAKDEEQVPASKKSSKDVPQEAVGNKR